MFSKKSIVSIILILTLSFSFIVGAIPADAQNSTLDDDGYVSEFEDDFIIEEPELQDEEEYSDYELDDVDESTEMPSDSEWTSSDYGYSSLNGEGDTYYDDEYEIEQIERTPIEQFVIRLYRYVFDREYDESGLNHWSDALRAGRTGYSVAHRFFFSTEFQAKNTTNEEFVTILYRTLLNREPDEPGLEHWVNRLSLGHPRVTVFASFVNSREFDALCRDAGITRGRFTPSQASKVREFVTRMYITTLEREADASGLEFWTNAILRGRTGAQVAQSFVFSNEMNNRELNDYEFIAILYVAMLGRQYDQYGMDFWWNRLASGVSRHELFASFVRSTEFNNICRNHGITRGTVPSFPSVRRNLLPEPTQGMPLSGRVVILDAGHGTVGSPGVAGYNEAVAMLDLARRIRPLLEAQGATVILTRDTETDISLAARAAHINILALEAVRNISPTISEVNEINRLIDLMHGVIANPRGQGNILMNVYPFNPNRGIHPDLRRIFEITNNRVIRDNFIVISLHSNASPNSGVRGADMYIIDPRLHTNTRTYFSGYSFTSQSRAFSSILLSHISGAGIPSRGIRAGNWVIIREINVPAVLAENGFHTNAHERALLSNPSFRQTLAVAYRNAIIEYFR